MTYDFSSIINKAKETRVESHGPCVSLQDKIAETITQLEGDEFSTAKIEELVRYYGSILTNMMSSNIDMTKETHTMFTGEQGPTNVGKRKTFINFVRTNNELIRAPVHGVCVPTIWLGEDNEPMVDCVIRTRLHVSGESKQVIEFPYAKVEVGEGDMSGAIQRAVAEAGWGYNGKEGEILSISCLNKDGGMSNELVSIVVQAVNTRIVATPSINAKAHGQFRCSFPLESLPEMAEVFGKNGITIGSVLGTAIPADILRDYLRAWGQVPTQITQGNIRDTVVTGSEERDGADTLTLKDESHSVLDVDSFTSIKRFIPRVVEALRSEISNSEIPGIIAKLRDVSATMTDRKVDMRLEDWRIHLGDGSHTDHSIVNFVRICDDPTQTVHMQPIMPRNVSGDQHQISATQLHSIKDRFTADGQPRSLFETGNPLQHRPLCGPWKNMDNYAGKKDEIVDENGTRRMETGMEAVTREAWEEGGLKVITDTSDPDCQNGVLYTIATPRNDGFSNAQGQFYLVLTESPVTQVEGDVDSRSSNEVAAGLTRDEYPMVDLPSKVRSYLAEGKGADLIPGALAVGMELNELKASGELLSKLQAVSAGNE